MAQIALWLVPMLALVRPEDAGSFVFPVLGLVAMIALTRSVRRHHASTLAHNEAAELNRQTLLSLGERETELRGIFENAAAGVAEIDAATGRILRVNRVYCTIFGSTEEQILKSGDFKQITHPDDRAEQSRQWAEIYRTGQSFQCERRYSRQDGSLLWGRLSISVAARDADGHPTRFIAIIQDITERKVAEGTVRENQDLLRLALEIGSVGSFRRDYVAGLIHCGAETRYTIGLPPGEAPIVDTEWFATLLPEDQPRFLKDVADARAERRAIVSFDYRFFHPEKGIRYAETRSRIDYDANGQATASVGVVIDVTERRQAQSRLTHLAHHDPLTDLPNRSLFQLRLVAALGEARPDKPCAVLCLDLDHFKDVNDSYGHPIGDALLCAVTARLRATCHPNDTVARLGGDEFAIIRSSADRRTDIDKFAKGVVIALAAPYNLDGHLLEVGTSIGIAVAPDHGLDPGQLLRHADMALYGAKASGRSRHQFFEPAMEERLQARRTLDTDLRMALTDGALDVFYQPLMNTGTRRVNGFEALIRWHHPERGFVMPDEFIPLAESNGLIVPIGAFVLERACTQASLWPNRTSVAVNLSASEFGSSDLVETVAGALRRSGLDPKRLELEITETTMLQDTRATLETLRKLKALGVRLSIDDFGTGFSSLGYLQRFPFDKVKIDRSFIAPLERRRDSLAIVKAVIDLCNGLDITTTAEGVETENQLILLAELGCAEAQGYYFSRPRPAQDVVDIIGQFDASARHWLSDVAAA